VFEDVTSKKRQHPKVHCPVTAKSKKKIKAFSVSSKERRNKCARIIKNLELNYRKQRDFNESHGDFIDYSQMLSVEESRIKSRTFLINIFDR